MIMYKKITEDNFDDCLHLEVDDSQKNFVAENTHSLAQAWLYPNNARPFAIYNGDEMVGFFMLDIDHHCDGSHKVVGLWRLMIDKKHQGKGYGKAVMLDVIKYVRSEYNPEAFRTSIVSGNDVAEKLYKSLGFIPNGEYDGDEAVMLLEFQKLCKIG